MTEFKNVHKIRNKRNEKLKLKLNAKTKKTAKNEK